MDQKPPANDSDPADLEVIEIAKKTISGHIYIALEEHRMNGSKKCRHILLLTTAIVPLNMKLTYLNEFKPQP
jgi:hypothetical protein